MSQFSSYSLVRGHCSEAMTFFSREFFSLGFAYASLTYFKVRVCMLSSRFRVLHIHLLTHFMVWYVEFPLHCVACREPFAPAAQVE